MILMRAVCRMNSVEYQNLWFQNGGEADDPSDSSGRVDPSVRFSRDAVLVVVMFTLFPVMFSRVLACSRSGSTCWSCTCNAPRSTATTYGSGMQEARVLATSSTAPSHDRCGFSCVRELTMQAMSLWRHGSEMLMNVPMCFMCKSLAVRFQGACCQVQGHFRVLAS